MKIARAFLCLLLLLPAAALSQGQTDSERAVDGVPADPQASPAACAVLRYLAGLSGDKFRGVVCGQNCFHGDQITDAKPEDGFNKLVAKLHDETGSWVGMVGVDYEYWQVFTSAQLSAANRILIGYWNKGGLITINWSPQNPWTNDESDVAHRPGDWQGPGSPSDLSHANLNDLLDPAQPVSAVWRRKLDRIAAALAELQAAVVVVLWRPLQEMNGNWFWWGIKSRPSDPAPYVRLYRDMFAYFTNTKGLHNLLWVYSPSASFGSDASSDWCKPVAWNYPGDDCVDVVAGTAYNDRLDIDDYAAYRRFGKPLGMAEYGPANGGEAMKKGLLDTRLYVERIRNDYRGIAYWVSWHDYPEYHCAIVANRHYRELLLDPGVLTLDRLSWQSGGPVVTTLGARAASLSTRARLRYEDSEGGGDDGWWTSTDDAIYWKLFVPADGEYGVSVRVSCDARYPGSRVAVMVGRQTLFFVMPGTGDWLTYRDVSLGRITLKAGTYPVLVKADSVKQEFVGNLRWIRFVR
jgi:mannan endo-1,4-beta-mannosidase